MSNSALLIPVVGGVVGGAATVLAGNKLPVHPAAIAAGAAVASAAIASAVKENWARQAATGAAIGAATLGGVQLLGTFLGAKAQASAPKPVAMQTRGAGGFVTRDELNDALARMAEAQTKQCDLMSALHAEIKRTVAPPRQLRGPRRHLRSYRPYRFDGPHCDDDIYDDGRNASGEDDYERNAYGEDDYERNAYGEDDYERNAHGEDDYERNAYGEDDYERNAYGEDDYERNAYGDEEYERNADAELVE